MGNWLLNLAAVLGIAYVVIKTIFLFRRQPPLERELAGLDARFAAADHAHPNLLTPEAIEKQSKACLKERMEIRKSVAQSTEKVETQIGYLRTELTSGLKELDAAAEARASGLHKRLDPISNATAANTRSIDNHLEDHRSKGT
ncbi:MAG: hypothetical protein HQ559_05695 [Lentisphaerae bacterium]|nr:hypothetical protein [Lentisphaerota bacterium]